MKSELTVLAECVDSRNGKRFQAGETFEPAPTEAQARRLVAANCLPGAAIDVAKKADANAERAEQERQKKAADAELVTLAEADHTAAEKAMADAEAALKGAAAADKAEAQKLVDATKKELEAAAKKLAELKK